MADIFISYASEDRATASSLSVTLEAAGWSVWWDRELVVGDNFAAEIESALDTAGCVVVLWSHAAANSRWVASEGQRAFDADKVVTVQLDGLAPPFPLSSLQAANLGSWDRTQAIDPTIEQLVSAVRDRLDPSTLLATAPCSLFRCVTVADWGCAAGAQDGIIRLFSLDDGRVIREFSGHGDMATTVAWNGANLLASGGIDRTARIWSLEQGEPARVLTGHTGPVDDVVFAGDRLVSVSSDQTARWWETTGEPVHSVTFDASLVSCGADRSGRLVAVGGTDGTVTVLIDGSSKTVLRDAHDSTVFAIDVAADGSRLLTAGADGLARLWDPISGAMVRTFRGHRGAVLAAALGSGVAVTGSSDETVRCWDTASGAQIAQLAGLRGGAPGVSLANGGRLIITGGLGQVRVAPLP